MKWVVIKHKGFAKFDVWYNYGDINLGSLQTPDSSVAVGFLLEGYKTFQVKDGIVISKPPDETITMVIKHG